MRAFFLRATVNSIIWLFKNQRTRISELSTNGIGQFELLLIPDYIISARFRRSIYVPRRVFFTANEDLIKHIFRLDREIVSAGSAYYFLSPFLGSRSVFVLDNQRHSFAKREIIATIKRDIKFDGEDVRVLDVSLRGGVTEGEYAILPIIQRISAQIVLHSIFPECELLDTDAVLNAAVQNISKVSGAVLLFPSSFPKRIGRMASIRKNKKVIVDFIRGRLKSGPASETYREQIEKYGIRFVSDNLLTLFIAGFETTAASITWGLIELSRSPEDQIALRKEINTAMGDAGTLIDYVASPHTLLHRYCLETFRRRPPIPFVLRKANKSFDYVSAEGSVAVKRGDYVLCSIEDHNRRAVTDGGEFSLLHRENHIDPSRLLTFGGGPKICPGRHVATTEFKLISALLLSMASFRPTEKTSSEPHRNRVSAVPFCGGHLGVQMV